MKNSFQLTAIKRSSFSVPLRNLLKLQVFSEVDKVLDYGCGHGFDVKELEKMGYKIQGYDKYNSEFSTLVKLTDYDVIISQYVFNVISESSERIKLIQKMRESGVKCYITVRSDITAIKPSWKYDRISEGWITSTGSFQRFYDTAEKLNEFGTVRIIKANKSFIQFELL